MYSSKEQIVLCEEDLASLSALHKDKFLNTFNNYDEPRVKQLYIQALLEIEKAVLGGSVAAFKRWSKMIEYMNDARGNEQLRTYDDANENPLRNTNLIILSCKHNNLDILKFLFNNTNKILNILSNDIANIPPTKEDEECHSAFYYAIRSGNVDFLEILINKWPDDYFGSRSEELEDLLSKGYEELKLKNVLLSDEMEYFVEDTLLNLRFFSKDAEDYKPSLDKIVERIDLVLEIFDLLKTKYAKEEVDQIFLFVTRFIAQNIDVLKRQLKSTYNKLPWEEIEFCLIAFVSSYIKPQEINLFYRSVMNKERLLYHLENFAAKLEEEKDNIMSSDITRLSKVPSLSREKVVDCIIADNNSFASLYSDYKEIRDIHSLQKINEYINLALSADCNGKEGQIIITRTLQVIGEHLKNTLESPKLSSSTSELLVLSTPDETREILMDLRNSLSHSYTLDKRTEIEENSDPTFYKTIQNDIRKINTVINEMFFSNKIKLVKTHLNKITKSQNVEEIMEVIEILRMVNIEAILIAAASENTKNEYEKIKKIVDELSDKLPEKTSYEEHLFKEIKVILNVQNSAGFLFSRNIKADYFQGILALKAMCMNFLIHIINDNMIRSLKFSASKALKNLGTHTRDNRMLEIGKTLFKILENVDRRISLDNRSEIWKLCNSIFYTVHFEANEIKGIEELRENLSKILSSVRKPKKKAKKANKPKLPQNYENQIAYKISTLENIFKCHEIAKDKFKLKFSIFKSKAKLQSAIESLVLDIISAVEGSGICFLNNNLFLDDYSPVLNGKCLRNHMAHGNALVDILLNDPSIAVLANAKIYSNISIIKTNKTVGKLIDDDPFKLKGKFHRDLELLTNQKHMFVALEEGNLEEVKRCLQKGADINARDLNLWTTLHFAAKGPSFEVVKFILDRISNFEMRDRNGDTPLHIAATYGRTDTVRYFVEHKGIPVDVINDTDNTSLHIASWGGHKDTVRILLKCKADLHATNLPGLSPIHLAAENNHQEVVEILLRKGESIDRETKGGFTSLHAAAEHGHLELVNFLLDKKADVNARNDKGGIPLHTTALRGHVDVVKTLIARGSNINTKVYDGCTALHYAIENGHEQIAKHLIDHGANVNATDTVYNNTSLHYAAEDGYKHIAEMLLRAGACVNTVTSESFTPLHLAALSGHKHIVDLLIDYRAQVNFETKDGCSALHLSALNNHKDVTDILLRRGADINSKDKNGNTPLYLGSFQGHTEIVEFFISSGADINATDANGTTSLHNSVSNNHMDVTKILLKNGADVNVKDLEDRTLLHYATEKECTTELLNIFVSDFLINAADKSGSTPLHLAVFYGNNLVVEKLIEKGANVNFKNKDDITPLQCAVQNNHKEVTETLIKYGADVNIKGKHGYTSLCYAVKFRNNEIVKLLITNGADVNVENGRPLSMAAFSGYKSILNTLLRNSNVSINSLNSALVVAALKGSKNIVESLISKGADVDCFSSTDTEPSLSPLYISADKGHKDIVEILIANGAQINAKSIEGNTPLHIAAWNNHINVIETLISNKAYVNAKDSKNRTPLELAVAYNRLQVIQTLLQHQEVDINARGNDGWTLLHISAQHGNLEITKHLVNKGGDVNAKNSLGSKPMHIAARGGHQDLLEYFLNNGNIINDKGAAGWTLLHYAVFGGRLEVLKYLINHNVDINAINGNGLRPLHYATSRETAELLINNGAFLDVNEVHRNILNVANSEIIKLLKVTEKLFEVVKGNKPLEVENCITNGAFINAKNTGNVSPLHFASWKGYDNVVSILLKYKANPNVVGKGGCTPLHYASKFNHLKIVIDLFSHGAIYNFKNSSNKIPLDFADNEEIKKLLTLIADTFRNVQNDNSKVINNLKRVKDAATLTAVANACNKECKSLLVVAIHNDFSKLKQLRQVFESSDSAELCMAELFISRENYEAALNIYTMILEKRKQIFGSDSPCTLSMQANVAKILFKKGKYQEVLNMYEDIYLKQRKALGPNNEDTLRTRSTIALIYHELGKDREALDIFNDVASKQEELLGRSHLDTLDTKFHMALVLDRLGKYEEALNINYEIYEKKKTNLGMNDPVTLSAYNNVAMVLNNQGKHEEALKIYKDVYERRNIVLGPVHSDTLRVLHNIGGVLICLKNNNESLKIYQEVLDIQSSILGPSHPDTLRTSYNIGNILFFQGKYIAALKAFTVDLDHKKTVWGPNHPIVRGVEEKLEAIKFTLRRQGIDTTNVLKHSQGHIETAVHSGDIEMVETLLKQGTEINFRDSEGRTLLHFAVNSGRKDIVNLLLNNKADATKVTNKGNTPLHTATFNGYKEIVDILLQHVKQFNYDNFNDFINARTTSGGTTALHVASKSDFIEIVKCLLTYGAIFEIPDQKKNKPIHLSVNQEVIDILKLLEEAFECAENGNIKIIKKLKRRTHADVVAILNARNSQGQTSIQVAFINNHEDLGKAFLKML